jgi:2-methylcitrate dehydratase
VLTAQYPKGHAQNPMSDAEVDLKFMNLCEPLMGETQRDALLGALWKIDRAPDVGGIINLLQIKQ